MDSESDSIASDDGGSKKEPVKKPVSAFIKKKSSESAEETIKSVAAKNPFSMAQSKRSNATELIKKKTEDVNLNINKKSTVVSKIKPVTFTAMTKYSFPTKVKTGLKM